MKRKPKLCNVCGKEIASSAKICPYCGAKIKKPLFKKWWFWTIIIVLVAAIGSGSQGDSPSHAETSLPPSPSSPSVDEVFTSDTPTPIESEPTLSQNQDNSTETIGQRNALNAAKKYLNVMAFSYEGLIHQLEFEKYTTEQATYGADSCGADWNEQAARSAKNYLNLMSFSHDSLITQLEFEGFTHEQAVYGAEANGY